MFPKRTRALPPSRPISLTTPPSCSFVLIRGSLLPPHHDPRPPFAKRTSFIGQQIGGGVGNATERLSWGNQLVAGLTAKRFVITVVQTLESPLPAITLFNRLPPLVLTLPSSFPTVPFVRIFCLALALLSFAFSSRAATPNLVNGIAVIVGDAVITYKDIQLALGDQL